MVTEGLLLHGLVWAVFVALSHRRVLHNRTAPMTMTVDHASSKHRSAHKRLAPVRRCDRSFLIRSRLHRSDSRSHPLVTLFTLAPGDEQFGDLQQVTDSEFIVTHEATTSSGSR